MVLAGVSDCLNRRIPNVLTALVFSSFFPFALAQGLAWNELGFHLFASISVLALAYGCFALGLIGGGDAKLLAATALWFGVPDVAAFLVMTALAGGVLALIISIWSLVSLEVDLRNLTRHARVAWVRPSVPYGFAISAGAILATPGAWWGPDVPFWSLLTIF